jgi:hypothetical protein
MRRSLAVLSLALGATAVMTSGAVANAETATPTPAAVVAPASYSSCLSGDFCAYSATGGKGTKKAWYKCQTVGRPFNTVGSLYNHQTGGAVVIVYFNDGSTPMRVPAGFKFDQDWRQVSKIKTC